MKKWPWFILSLVVIALDQLSKYWSLQHLIPYLPKKVMPMFNLTLAFNTGSAFSFLSDAGAWHRYFLTGFSGMMSIIIIIWISRTPARNYWQLLGLSLILGGALGNLMDRILLGHVVDFIDVYYQTLHWPVFNLADSAVCVGAAILLFCCS